MDVDELLPFELNMLNIQLFTTLEIKKPIDPLDWKPRYKVLSDYIRDQNERRKKKGKLQKKDPQFEATTRPGNTS